jgi:hypothetical protein
LTAAGNGIFFAPEVVQNKAVTEDEFNREKNEAGMKAELNLLEVWIPEQMQPGTIFMLEKAGELGKVENPFWAVLACPSCGSLGLITRQQCAGLEAMICGAETCSSEYFLEDGKIRFRPAN